MRLPPSLANFPTKKIVSGVGALSLITLAAWPALHLLYLIASTGADNVSNDYTFWVPIVNEVLNGTYAWGRIFKDSLRAGHSFLLPLSVHLLAARWAHLNIFLELYLGWLLFGLRLWLFHAALTHGRPRTWRWWALWPVLSALTFSVSQVSVLTFGDTALQMGFSSGGMALGVWGLRRWPGRWTGFELAALGALLATWSWGSGPWLWLLFLPALGWAGFRAMRFYLLWLLAAAISLTPHLYYGLIAPAPGALSYINGASPETVLAFLNRLAAVDAEKFISGLGRPFANDLGTRFEPLPLSSWMGALGLSLAVIGAVYAWRRRLPARRLAPALVSLSYGVLGMWLTTVLRDGIAPWYTTQAMAFWVGLAGLAYLIAEVEPRVSRVTWPGALWGVSVMSLMSVGYLLSNLHYEDKVFHLYSRSPVSAACLRQYVNAPTYCEQYLFQWGLGRAGPLEQFARPLERHQLSVFAPRQTWTLQGDFVLDTVLLSESPVGGDSYWAEGLSATPVPFANYKHLNLFLPSPNAIDWTLTLPPGAGPITFDSAIALRPGSPEAGEVTFEILILGPEAVVAEAYRWDAPGDPGRWQPIQLALDAYAGQTITLRLGSQTASGASAWAMYRYPTLSLEVRATALENPNAHARPANTEVSPYQPAFTAKDFVFNLTDQGHGTLHQVASVTEAEADQMGTPALMTITAPDLCLADYSHVAVQLAAAPEVSPRYFQLNLFFEGGVAANQIAGVQIPLLADGEPHVYTYPLKLLELTRGTRLTGLSLQTPPGTASPMRLDEVRLIGTDLAPGGCAAR